MPLERGGGVHGVGQAGAAAGQEGLDVEVLPAVHPQHVGDAGGLGVAPAPGGQEPRHLEGAGGRAVQRAEVAGVTQVDGGDQLVERRSRGAPRAGHAVLGQAPARVGGQAEAGDRRLGDQRLKARLAGGHIDAGGALDERHPADVAIIDLHAARLGERPQMADPPAPALHRMHAGDDPGAGVLGHGGVQHGGEGLGPTPAAGHRFVLEDLVHHDHRRTFGQHGIVVRDVGRAVVLAEVGLEHHRHQAVDLVRFLRRQGGSGLDQLFQLRGLRGVVVHAHEVGGEAERGVGAAAKSGGRQQPVFQGEVGQTEPLRFPPRRPLQSPAGEAVQAGGRRQARRQEFEAIAAVQEPLQPARLQRHADGAHAHAQRPGGRGGGDRRRAGSKEHVCYPGVQPSGMSPKRHCIRLGQICQHWAFRRKRVRRASSG